MPVIERKGSQSSQGFGEFAQTGAAVYIEDVFQTWLYTGNNTSRSITNGVDLSTKGGLVWTKVRSVAGSHCLIDTARGTSSYISSNLTDAAATDTNLLTAFNTNGYTLGTDPSNGLTNFNNFTYASWTFRKQPKFFDIVTYTGNGSNRTIAHNLGSVPGCIIIKRTDTTAAWAVYHRSLANTEYLVLNTTAAKATGATYWNSTTPTATEFSLGTATDVNANTGTYIAYLFAHDAGGFGLTGTDNVISCGTYNGNGGVNSINIGFEPQWLLIKTANYSSYNWMVYDNMRGMTVTENTSKLRANLANGEVFPDYAVYPTATGFGMDIGIDGVNQSGGTYIYIAIRRGPMKTPTSGTSVFAPVYQAGGGTVTTNFVVDTSITKDVAVAAVGDNFVWDRLRGSANVSSGAVNLKTNSTAIESAGNFTAAAMNVSNTAVTDSFYGSGYNVIYWNFRRAPGFFDTVCYTGTGANRTLNHNLGVVPEMMIVKARNGFESWYVYHSATGNTKGIQLNGNGTPVTAIQFWNNTTPTATVFTVGTADAVNSSAYTYVAYLFATAAGVSKVGSYTGTGALQTVNCGFTGGARFVLIRRTDAGGDWYIYDSARGITSGNDPYLLMNSTAAQVTGTNYVDTTSVGFQVTAAAPAGLNANGGTYIFLAIA